MSCTFVKANGQFLLVSHGLKGVDPVLLLGDNPFSVSSQCTCIMYVLNVMTPFREFVRERPVKTVGLRRTGNTCLVGGARGRCRYMYFMVKDQRRLVTYHNV